MGKNDSKRKLKYEFTFGNFFSALENFPDLVKGHESTLEEIRSMIETEIEKPFTEGNEEYGLIHGDLWSGNILIPNSGWQVDKDASENTLHVIDWEFAQFSHRSTDFGQLIGDLYERKVFGNLENGVQVMEGLIDGYGPLSDEMAFRTAMYVGMHLVIYYLRRPMSGPRVVSEEAIVAGLTIGRDFMVKAWAKDREFFEGSELASLFTVAG
ncbi:hypothetical protein HK100_005309 [Physocladia obscura]|uniref:Aminoglycoside phosphotransferase domain-containing protein n=1 Tax=Physocladia obscura TaxID=109957 RepID=A0AAD5STA3_9FUNG|nr:hypothetical protein HK100_005309 [Physocladia obscura]